jgi:hypothetical protein
LPGATSKELLGARFNGLRVALYVLLGINVCLFVASGTWSEALDSAAWFVLLALFEAETRKPFAAQSRTTAVAVRSTRFLATVAIGIAALGYLYERDWLNAINAWLWIGVVLLLEFEIRRPHTVMGHRSAFLATACVLYGGLALVVAAWLRNGEWLDAYDGLLWIIAFATIETDLVNRARTAVAFDSPKGMGKVG